MRVAEFSEAPSKNPIYVRHIQKTVLYKLCLMYFSEYDHEEDYVEFLRPKEMFIEKIFHGKVKKLVSLPRKLPQWVNKVTISIYLNKATIFDEISQFYLRLLQF